MYLFDDVMLECGWYVYLHLVLIFCFYNLSIVNHGYVLCTNLSNKWISLWNTYYLSLKVRKFEKQIIWSSFRSKFRKNFVRLFFGKYKYRLRLDRLLLNFPNLHTDVWDSPKKFYNKTFITYLRSFFDFCIAAEFAPDLASWPRWPPSCRRLSILPSWPLKLTNFSDFHYLQEHYQAEVFTFFPNLDELSKLLIFYVWNSANISLILKKISSFLINSVRS